MVRARQAPAVRESSGPEQEIVETGDIFFAYRPRISEPEAEGLSDVQRFYMVLKPEGGARVRLTVLGRKRLPETDGHERVWGFVDRVVKSGGEIADELKEQGYRTKELQKEFRGRRFAAEDPHLLDYEGAEFILIGARTDPERAYDIDIGAEQETPEEADIFQQLKVSRGEQPLEPLLGGKWK
jgi:hypothetical protein